MSEDFYWQLCGAWVVAGITWHFRAVCWLVIQSPKHGIYSGWHLQCVWDIQ